MVVVRLFVVVVVVVFVAGCAGHSVVVDFGLVIGCDLRDQEVRQRSGGRLREVQ